MNILITGSKGFIGSRLIEALRGKGRRVYGIDVEQDIEKLNVSPFRRRFDVVVHCAAQTSVTLSMDYPMIDAKTNILGTINLLKLFPKSKFIFLSSSAVYGEGPNHREDGPVNPKSPYAISKLAAENYIKLMAKSFVIFRLANVVGQGNKKTKNVFDIFHESESLTIYGDGSQRRDFVPVEVVCSAIEKALKIKGSGTFNIGSGRTVKIIDVAKSFKKPFKFRPERPGEIHSLSMNITHAIKQKILPKKRR